MDAASAMARNNAPTARRIAFEVAGLKSESHVPALGTSVGSALLEPHRSYLPQIRPLLGSGRIKGMAHITGGGITENLPRTLPPGTHAVVDRSAWKVPAIFTWLQQTGNVPDDDMLRTFNMGIGLILACAPDAATALLDELARGGESGAFRIGAVGLGGECVWYIGG